MSRGGRAVSGEEFIIKFNLQKLLGFGIDDSDTTRIAQVLNCPLELVDEITMKYRLNNLKQAEIIVADCNGLDALVKDSEKTIAFIGDSITSDRESYFNIIKVVFKNFKNINFIDAAVSGDRTANALISLRERVLKHKPQIDSIMLGTNDMRKTDDVMGICATSIGEYERNLRHIIERLIQDKVSIIINTLPPMDNNSFDYSYGEGYIKYDCANLIQYNDVIRKLSSEYHLILNDLSEVYSKFTAKELLLDDGIHLSTLAQRQVAANLFHKLVDLI